MGRWSGSWVPLLGTLLLVILFSLAMCRAASDLVCVPGLYTWGATSPKGDILLKEGDSLEVNCTIDLSSPKVKGLTSKNIRFSFTKHEIPDDRLKITILSNATAMVRVENMNASTPLLNCFLRHPTTNLDEHVCLNQVEVGYLPQPPENIHCTAPGWTSLVCNWTKPANHVITSYNISYMYKLRQGRHVMQCPHQVDLNATAQSCEWNEKTVPHYRANAVVIFIKMNGTNYLEPSGVIWEYMLNNWEIVIPSKPDRISGHVLSPHEIELGWGFQHFELFSPGLFHQVKVCPTNHPEKPCVLKEYNSTNVANLTQRIQVPYAFTVYRVEIRMRSQRANDTAEFWSPPAVLPEIVTKPKRPESPPSTAIGSFEISNRYEQRDVTVYWERIPLLSRNGSDFHYELTVYENDQPSDRRAEMKDAAEFAVFKNLTLDAYRFEIISSNSEGRSEQRAVILLPGSSQAPKGPVSVSKLDYSNGTYEVSWRPPNPADSITSYTVYRCLAKGSQCIELLDWKQVGPHQTHFVYHTQSQQEGALYIFAVSANTEKFSSGMVLATCELINGKVPGKLKDVRVISRNSTEVEVKWKLDCSYKPGLVEKFRITYCQAVESLSCIHSNNRKESEAPPDQTSYTLHDLEPFSRYLVWISMVTRAGESQSSDPLLVNTTEAAPSDPPRVSSYTTTNTSALLEIQPPNITNGIVRQYRLIYESLDAGKGEILVDVKRLVEGSQTNTVFQYTLSGLESNANYSLMIAAFTQDWSDISEPFFFTTKIGRTKVTSEPSLSYDEGNILVRWSKPKHLGGPVENFEVLVKRNGEVVGEDGQSREVRYINGKLSYEYQVPLVCESNTNVTAKVRAITTVVGEVLYGDWSPEGQFRCYGTKVWYIWIFIVIASVASVVILAFILVQGYRKYKKMKDITIINTPGEDPAIPMSHQFPKKPRQNSGGDTYAYGKENLTYQGHNIHPSLEDETKDFLSGDSSKEQFEKAGPDSPSPPMEDSPENRVIVPRQDSSVDALLLGNEKCPVWLWNSPIIPTGDQENKFNRFNQMPQFSSPFSTPAPANSPPPQPTDGLLLETRISPFPTNPLLCNCSNEARNGTGVNNKQAHYKTAKYLPNGEPPCNGTCHCDGDPEDEDDSYPTPVTLNISLPFMESPSVLPNRVLQISTSQENSDLSDTNSESGSGSGRSSPSPVPHVPPKASPYVKWTELTSDPSLGGLNDKLPYCHVAMVDS